MKPTDKALELLEWVSRCAKIMQPYGGHAYAISEEKMAEIKELLAGITPAGK